MNVKALSGSQKATAISIILAAIGAFLPWVSVLGINVSGIRGDGRITLVCAALGAVFLALGTPLTKAAKLGRTPYLVLSLIAGGIVAIVGMYDMNSFAAIGLYLTMFAGIAWVIAVFIDWRTRLAATQAAADAVERKP